MLEFLAIFIGNGKYNLRSILGKVIVTKMICKHPELSDEKVKNITNMMLQFISLYMSYSFFLLLLCHTLNMGVAFIYYKFY